MKKAPTSCAPRHVPSVRPQAAVVRLVPATRPAPRRRPALRTPASRPLTPGEYRWVVYPVYGGDGSLGSGLTADTQLAQGTFTL